MHSSRGLTHWHVLALHTLVSRVLGLLMLGFLASALRVLPWPLLNQVLAAHPPLREGWLSGAHLVLEPRGWGAVCDPQS